MPGIVSRLFEKAHQEARGHPGLFVPEWLALAADLVFPPRCAGCGRVDTMWCGRCQRALDMTPYPRHIAPLAPLTGMAATAVHEGIVQQVIWSLKYENARRLAEPLGDRLAARLSELDWPVDMVVPVPMHAARLAERGYNQAQLLAERVGRVSGLACSVDTIRRWRMTPSQVGLGRDERLRNVQDAFEAGTVPPDSTAVLLVDDVYTTGATLSACADALFLAGAAAVYGLTVSAARQ